MSLGQISRTGAKTPIAGLNGLSGELVPSVSYYQTGTKTSDTTSWASGETGTFTIALSQSMPDKDYVVVPTLSVVGVSYIVHDKTVSGFKVTVRNDRAETVAVAITLSWQAFKLMTDESRALDEQAIADNAAAITALKTYGKKVLWSGTATKGDTVSFDSTGYDELYAVVGGMRIRCVSNARGNNIKLKFCGQWCGRDTYTSTDMQGLYRQDYVLDILSGGTIACCAWFHIDNDDGVYKSENSVNVTQIIGVKYPTIA